MRIYYLYTGFSKLFLCYVDSLTMSSNNLVFFVTNVMIEDTLDSALSEIYGPFDTREEAEKEAAELNAKGDYANVTPVPRSAGS